MSFFLCDYKVIFFLQKAFPFLAFGKASDEVLMWVCLYIGATFCICRDGIAESSLQKTLDYACGAGADCTPILQNGGCFNPNTVKDHCNYAVNSYFQKKGQSAQACDFAGTAVTSPTAPSSN